MQQYVNMKKEYSDCLLMFRLGDFYELFFDDAVTAARELELTLTGKSCGLEERAPMCGVPHHAIDSYLVKLVNRGYKVAIGEQLEDPAKTKGIVKRDVVKVITPGTIDIAGSTSGNENVYIASIFILDSLSALACADITTGEMFAMEFEDDYSLNSVITELSKISPRELITASVSGASAKSEIEYQQICNYINPIDDSYYKLENCKNAVMHHFNMISLTPLGLDGRDEITIAAGSLLMYLTETQKQSPSQIKHMDIRDTKNHMQLSRSTIRNLELLETMYDKQINGSLLGVLDKTKTAMGGRLLKKTIKEPLNDTEEIKARLNAVESLINAPEIRNNLKQSLYKIYDFERLTARIASGKANAKDMIALKTTVNELPIISELLRSVEHARLIVDIADAIPDFSDIKNIINSSIVDEPPFVITEGGIIKTGYSSELDELKSSIQDAKDWILELESVEREKTGIKTLKVGYNKVFGYYIDVSKLNADHVPENYIRKQTLVNNERYITPELKEKENLVLTAESKINAMEYDIFCSIRLSVEPYIEVLQKASKAVALLDVLLSFAETAVNNRYVKPDINDASLIEIKNGRHPAVEQMIGDGMFVSNDTYMDKEYTNMLIITGPNMSGKSTYMRQTAIIVLMAQMGSFVPCDSACIGITDRVFTRIGASDNLAFGQSTFYVEMSELANILRNATQRSLIILDEIGRGTSTFDGLSIAWATIEYLCRPEFRIRTMFATHYHELTELAKIHDTVKNLSVAISEKDGNIVFLHKLAEHPASKSYGIHVAKIAGVPAEIRKNAAKKLKELESQSMTFATSNDQMSIFDKLYDAEYDQEHDNRRSELLENIAAIDINELKPLDAMIELNEIVSKATAMLEDERG